MSLAAGYELNIHDHTWIFQVVGHRPEVWMPNQEPVGVEAKGVSEGAELASRSQGPEREDWNVDPTDSSRNRHRQRGRLGCLGLGAFFSEAWGFN